MKQCTTRKESGKQMMSQNLNQKMSPMQTSGVSDSHARISPLQENSGDLSESEVGYITTLLTSSKAKKESDKPTYLLVENVKNLLSINSGFDFASVLSEMDEAGYDCRWQVLNSKDFGVPKTGSVCSLSQILEAEVDEKYYLSAEKTQQLLTNL